VTGRLVVVEEPERVLVAYADDPSDWLCEFSKAGGFPARRWAESMVAIWNAQFRIQPPSTSSV
jgi:hypothetical protein